MSKNYLIYKPCGVMSQLRSNDPKEQKKVFLRSLYDFPNGVMPVGRLDEKSEGLLLLTTDGKLSDRINRSGIEKQYYAQLDGIITSEALQMLRSGVEIGLAGTLYKTLSCKAQAIEAPENLPPPHPMLRIERHRPSSWVSLTLTEGKFRQVRKMTSATGFPTLRLVRVRIGNLKLGNMKPGEVREIQTIGI